VANIVPLYPLLALQVVSLSCSLRFDCVSHPDNNDTVIRLVISSDSAHGLVSRNTNQCIAGIGGVPL
jgi:hypothetical protein